MKKTVLCALALLGLVSVAAAQAPTRFGIVGGLHSSTLRLANESISKVGFHLGAVAEISINDNFLVRPQVLFNTKGGSETNGGRTASINLTYIELPIHAVYKAEVGNGKLFGGAGPYFGFLAGASDQDGDKLTGISSFDAGLSLMGGYELTENRLGFNLFYNTGLTNLNSNSSVSITNGTFGLSIAYFFGE